MDILRYLIRTYSNEGDLVIDPTMGSGSCGEACWRENRRFIGIDMSDKWFSFAESRMIALKHNETVYMQKEFSF